MKVNNFTLFTLLWLAVVKMAFAAEAQNELFLYSLSENNQDQVLVAPMRANKIELANRQSEQTLALDYNEPCDIKCGISTTGLVLLHMVVESKANQEYRYSLMNPNYEP